MIYVNLPLGRAHGWGVCGRYLTRELARLTDGQTRLLTRDFRPDLVEGDLEYHDLKRLHLPDDQLKRFPFVQGIQRLDGPLFTCIEDNQRFLPQRADLRGTRTVGYTFFENNILHPKGIENARRHFDLVVTGSSWCTQLLKDHGLSNVATLVQGIDTFVFHPRDPEEARVFLRDKFVVFSGGKIEFRKGQDLVIRAFKVLQDRHADVLLVASWFNPWQTSLNTMQASPWIKFAPRSKSFEQAMSQVLADNGLDASRVLSLGSLSNTAMARVYHNTDVGVFPNRCEGGTNLVLMEYMACGKPVIAAATTGHADIVNDSNALIVQPKQEATLRRNDKVIARWPEPDLDELIEKLEWSYQHRDQLRTLGETAGTDLARFTWRKMAEECLLFFSETI